MMRTNALQEKHLYGGVVFGLPALQSREESGFSLFYLSGKKNNIVNLPYLVTLSRKSQQWETENIGYRTLLF